MQMIPSAALDRGRSRAPGPFLASLAVGGALFLAAPALAAPVISGISPSSATAMSGDVTVTITGTGLSDGYSAAYFYTALGSSASLKVTSQNATSITATIPSDVLLSSCTTCKLEVWNGLTSSKAFAVNNPAPTATSLTPATATAGAAQFTLTVNGTKFAKTAKVRWEGADLTTTYVSSTKLTATVPATKVATAGTAKVTVFNPTPVGGTSTALNFLIDKKDLPKPKLTKVEFDSFDAAGDVTLKFTGTDFQSGVYGTAKPDKSVLKLATISVSGTLKVTMKLADFYKDGKILNIPFAVVNPDGKESDAEPYKLALPKPAITLYSPGITIGATARTVTLTGTNFPKNAVVRIGGLDRVTTWVSTTSVKFDLTDADVAKAASHDATVGAPDSTVSDKKAITIDYPTPKITSVSPTNVLRLSDAMVVTVTGSGFADGQTVRIAKGYATADLIGTASATVISSTQLTVEVPASAFEKTGDVFLWVVNPNGGVSNDKRVKVSNPTPVISSVVPSTLFVGGPDTSVTLKGSGFYKGGAVLVGTSSRKATYELVSDKELKVYLNAADYAVSGKLFVAVWNDPTTSRFDSASVYVPIVYPKPTLISIDPAYVDYGKTTKVTLKGTGFTPASVVKIASAGSAVASKYVSPTELTADVNWTQAGEMDFWVYNPKTGGGDSEKLKITVGNPVPTLTKAAPASIMRDGGDTKVTLTGTDFTSASTATFNGKAVKGTYLAATIFEITIPAAELKTAGSFDVAVTTPSPGGGTATLTGGVTVKENPKPVLTSLSMYEKLTGTASATLTLKGSGFIKDSVVRVNGKDRSTSYVSDGELTIVMPTADFSLAGERKITVFNKAPAGGESAALTLTVKNSTPILTKISTTQRTAGDPAFDLTLTGTAFMTVSVVRLNGQDRPTTYVSSSSLKTKVTADDLKKAGTLSFTVASPSPGGGDSAAKTLTVVNAPLTLKQTTQDLDVGVAATFALAGTGFLEGAKVFIDGREFPATFVDAKNLTVAIGAADFAKGGLFRHHVLNPDGKKSEERLVKVHNLAAAVTDWQPREVTAGSSDVTVTITGTGFMADAAVEWVKGLGATTANITQQSGESLEVILPASLVTLSGKVSFNVKNPDPNRGVGTGEIVVKDAPARIALSKPVAGESVQGGASYQVRYGVSGKGGAKIRLSVTGDETGQEVTVLEENASFGGAYAWSVPDLDAPYAVIVAELLDSAGAVISTSMAGPFAIKASAAAPPCVGCDGPVPPPVPPAPPEPAPVPTDACTASGKATVCHVASTVKIVEICVAESAVQAHLDHGDHRGACLGNEAPPSVCGNAFCDADETSLSCPADCKVPSPPSGPTCGDLSCETGETDLTCPLDCRTAPLPSGPACGNNVCELGETDVNCPVDCKISLPAPGPTCGDLRCEATETASSCSKDCAMTPIPTGPTCGDLRCEVGEDAGTCADDCKLQSTLPPACGNDACEIGESAVSCPVDCKIDLPGPQGPACGNKLCEVGESWAQCPADCRGGGIPPPSGPICGDNVCHPGETPQLCALDCRYTPKPDDGPLCGNGLCELGEVALYCPLDCKAAPLPIPPVCGNGLCEAAETGSSCVTDCRSMPLPKPPVPEGTPLPPAPDIGLNPPKDPLPPEDVGPGSKGPGLMPLCDFLRANGYALTGECKAFDKELEDALIAFQTKYTDDGELGPATVAFLNGLLRQQALGACKTAFFTLIPPEKAFTRPLKFGDRGDDVRVLQKFLNDNGFLLGTSGPGAPAEETQLFVERTRTALRYFQNAFGLTSERGRAGPKNRFFINNLLAQPPVLKCPVLIPASETFDRDMAYGVTDRKVQVLQTFLNVNRFLLATTAYGSRTQETSFFGPYTRAALTRFQIAFKLLAERNRLGPLTRKFINDLRVKGVAVTVDKEAVAATCAPLLTKYIRANATNDAAEVRKLQDFLRTREGFADVRTTGSYDDATQRAVIAFQERYAADILTPWGETKGTAYVFRTTQKKINDLWCAR